MTIIWGGGRKSKNPGKAALPFWCGREEKIRVFGVLENYRYAHLYGLRIAKWDTHRWMECGDCEYKVPIPSKEGFAAARAISDTWNVLRLSDPTTGQIWEIVARVAEEVMGDQELAQATRKAAKEVDY
jgi:hypothetical protein